MAHYEIGKPYPVRNIAEGKESICVDMNEDFFDIRCYVTDPDPVFVNDWNSGKLHYGLYKRLHIPFLLFDFKVNGYLTVSLNIYQILTAEAREKWLNRDGTEINIYLIHTDSNIISARRTLSIPFSLAEEVRDIMERQAHEYPSKTAVEKARATINLEPEKMIERCKMVKAK